MHYVTAFSRGSCNGFRKEEKEEAGRREDASHGRKRLR